MNTRVQHMCRTVHIGLYTCAMEFTHTCQLPSLRERSSHMYVSVCLCVRVCVLACMGRPRVKHASLCAHVCYDYVDASCTFVRACWLPKVSCQDPL